MKSRITICVFFLCITFAIRSQVSIKADIATKGLAISQDLIGAFFEDINYAADGGLYGELIQNRSFEYYPVTDSLDNNMVYVTMQPLDAWTVVAKGGATATIQVENTSPLNAKNTRYLKLAITKSGTEAGVKNSGFNGINVVAGNYYNFSVYLRSEQSTTIPFVVRLETSTGAVIGSDTIKNITTQWQKYERKILCKVTNSSASLVLVSKATGIFYADMVSLFPANTYKNRNNGLRADLAQTIADMRPRFLRFPGGCVSHGRGIANMYRWKETLGDVAQRKPNWNMWGYHQTLGLGFYEYFQCCEDIGAKPFPVLPVGVSCQFRRREIVPISDMKPYIDDALDLVQFANGDSTTIWGKVRAQMGHPQPFNLEYMCLGNEEDDIPEFRTRFIMVADSLRKYYPTIKILGTSGTAPSGSYYNTLWQFSKQQKIAGVDEHYYVDPSWLLDNFHRYDKFDRNGPKVFIGEWASRDDRLKNAIYEAAYLTSVERNADVVQFTCYAPLLVSENKPVPWRPDLIRFDNTRIAKTPNYYVQQLYSTYSGDQYITSAQSYDAGLTADTLYAGKVGVGSWNTQARFKDVKVTVDDKILLAESFTAGSGNWTVNAGTFSATGGLYYQTSTAAPAWSVCNTVINQPAYTYTLKAMKTGGAEGFLIPFAFKGTSDYYWLNIGGWGNTQNAIEKSVNGVKSTLFTASGSIQNNVWYDIKIDVTREGAKFFINGTLIFDIPAPGGPIATSVVKDTKNNKIYVKVANVTEKIFTAKLQIKGVEKNSRIDAVVLTGTAPDVQNLLATPNAVTPVKSSFMLTGDSLAYNLPAYSFVVFSMDIDPMYNGIGELFYQNAPNTKNHVKIVPNPMNHTTDILFKNPSAEEFNFKLFNSQGKLVYEKCRITDNHLVFNRDKLRSGVYNILISSCKSRYEGKLLID